MTALANISEVLNRLTGGNNGYPETYAFAKNTAQTLLAGVMQSTWLWNGYPGPGVAPGAAAVPTRATAGAFRHLNPTGGRQRWLRSLSALASSVGRVLIYDRLLHCSGLSGTTTTAQNVGTAVTRYTGAESVGNIIFAEIYTAVGNAAVNLTCNYLDSAGTARASSGALIGSTSAKQVGNCVVLPYDNAANSVTQVVDVTLASSMGVPAGDFGVTIARPLAELQIGGIDTAGNGHGARLLLLDDVEIKTDACLGFLVLSPAATMVALHGSYTTVER